MLKKEHDNDDDDDLHDVMLEETSRGRKRIDTAERRRMARILRSLRRFKPEDEREFLDFIRRLGVRDGSPHFERVVKIWRDLSRR